MTISNVSEKGIPLLWQGQVDVPVVTAEAYEKWYSLYIVYPDRRVEKVSPVLIDEVMSKGPQLWIDHEFHPRLLLLIAKHVDGEAHSLALEVAAGRWVMNNHSNIVPMEYFLENEDPE